MAKKDITVQRIGNSKHPITTKPVPVSTGFGVLEPYYVDDNGTIIGSTVNRKGINEQTFYHSNRTPSFKLTIKNDGINPPDTLKVEKYTDPNSFIAYDKVNPNSEEGKEIINKSKLYGVPLATREEAVANGEEVDRQVDEMTPDGLLERGLNKVKDFGSGLINERLPQMIKKYEEAFKYNRPINRNVKPIAGLVESLRDMKKSEGPENMYKTITPENVTSMLPAHILENGLALKPIVKKNYAPQLMQFQSGGSIMERVWNKWTGNDTYVDGYGTVRHHTPVWESAHNKIRKAADTPLVQAMPIIGDVADGYVAADYAAKGNFTPALASIGAGLILPNAAETVAKAVPSSAYKKIADKVGDVVGKKGAKTIDGIPIVEPENIDDAVEILGVEYPKNWRNSNTIDPSDVKLVKPGNTGRKYPKKFNRTNDDYVTWSAPEPNLYDVDDAAMGYMAHESPWDTPLDLDPWNIAEYQEGGNLPSNDQQQLFVAIITDMAATLGVEPSQEFAEAVLTAFEKQDDSQGLITLFTKTKDKFMNETGLFREGGKMFAFVDKFKCGGKSPKRKTSKKQEGGEVEGTGAQYITTPVNDRKMRRAYRDRTGASRAEARRAQRDIAANMEAQGGISGRAARNSAAAMMGDPQRFAQPMQPRTIVPQTNAQLNVNPTIGPAGAIADPNYDQLGFNQAFGRARSNGAGTFNWRGNEYTTELANPSRIDQVQDRVNGGIDKFQEANRNVRDRIQAGVNKGYDSLQAGIHGANDKLQEWGNSAIDGVQNFGNRVGDAFQNANNTMFDRIQSATNVLGLRPQFVDNAIDKVQDFGNRVYDAAQNVNGRIVDGVQQFGNNAYDKVQSVAQQGGDWIQNAGNKVYDAGQDAFDYVVDGAQNIGNRVVDGVQNVGSRIGNRLQRAGQKVSRWFR